jgi:hypothetical protein
LSSEKGYSKARNSNKKSSFQGFHDDAAIAGRCRGTMLQLSAAAVSFFIWLAAKDHGSDRP